MLSRIFPRHHHHTLRRAASTFAAAFDIDGVLVQGKHVISSARTAIQQMHSHRIPFLVITNGGGRLESYKAAQLSEWLGVCIEPGQVMMSHTPMRGLVEKYRDERVLVLGWGDPKGVLKSYGFRKVVTTDEYAALHPYLHPFMQYNSNDAPEDMSVLEVVRAVMVLSDPVHWAQDIQVLCDVLRSEGDVLRKPWPSSSASSTAQQRPRIKVYASNSDMLWRHEFHEARFGQGAFHHAMGALYESLTGEPFEQRLVRFGKPFQSTYSYANQLLAEQAKQLGYDGVHKVYAVGDNPFSDIAGANAAGWVSILTRTGVFDTGAVNHDQHPAAYVVQDVGDAVNIMLRLENKQS